MGREISARVPTPLVRQSPAGRSSATSSTRPPVTVREASRAALNAGEVNPSSARADRGERERQDDGQRHRDRPRRNVNRHRHGHHLSCVSRCNIWSAVWMTLEFIS
jgi:hypothetical protein